MVRLAPTEYSKLFVTVLEAGLDPRVKVRMRVEALLCYLIVGAIQLETETETLHLLNIKTMTLLSERDECTEDSPCANGATCEDLLVSYYCRCAPGYRGKNCSDDGRSAVTFE